MSKKNVHAELKKLRETLKIALGGHDHRIKEQKAIIKEAKRCIKMHNLLKKSARNEYKLKSLEVVK